MSIEWTFFCIIQTNEQLENYEQINHMYEYLEQRLISSTCHSGHFWLRQADMTFFFGISTFCASILTLHKSNKRLNAKKVIFKKNFFFEKSPEGDLRGENFEEKFFFEK